jgi:hypothetical protein
MTTVAANTCCYAIHLDVDVVTDLVEAQVGGEWDVTLLAEGGTRGSRACTQPMGGRHAACLLHAVSGGNSASGSSGGWWDTRVCAWCWF